MYNLPDELLAHIFLITTHNADLVDLHIDPFIKSYYQQLFILTSVCSRWRSICLSQGSFWSKIPLSHNVKGKAFGFIMDLCLERARDSDLHVVGLVIARHGPQIRSGIIEGNHPSELHRALLMLLDFSRPGNIATLYIRDYEASLHPHSSGPWYLFHPTSAEHAQLTTFVKHLTELCVKDRCVLVSLTLQGVIIEDISTMINLLIALPSAPRLQHLKLLDLAPNAFLDYTQQFNQHPHLPVRLASLQSLLMKDLDADFIFVLLQAIAPGSYPITLSFSSQSHLFTLLEGLASRKTANDDLKDMPAPNAFTLRDFNIDTLALLPETDWTYDQNSRRFDKSLASLPVALHLTKIRLDMCDKLLKEFKDILDKVQKTYLNKEKSRHEKTICR
ncbi:unnamed protein product [Rhizoctonia solani]|uniref:F-box domain-containing protein n=1 Tax=Rhizoctonia solani TaxID=456999 RepID=A0A8H3HAS8_9AGAM|nr:unnamed protein product [Rhizoctonia solani]